MPTFKVSEMDNEVEVDGIVFFVRVPSTSGSPVNLMVAGGYAQDDDGEWWEMDDEIIRTLFDDGDFIEYREQEFEIEVTADDVRKAKEYYAAYPLSVG